MENWQAGNGQEETHRLGARPLLLRAPGAETEARPALCNQEERREQKGYFLSAREGNLGIHFFYRHRDFGKEKNKKRKKERKKKGSYIRYTTLNLIYFPQTPNTHFF